MFDKTLRRAQHQIEHGLSTVDTGSIRPRPITVDGKQGGWDVTRGNSSRKQVVESLFE